MRKKLLKQKRGGIPWVEKIKDLLGNIYSNAASIAIPPFRRRRPQSQHGMRPRFALCGRMSASTDFCGLEAGVRVANGLTFGIERRNYEQSLN